MPAGSSGLDSRPHGKRTTKPAAANAIHAKSIARLDVAIATARGPVNSKATAMPNGIRFNDR